MENELLNLLHDLVGDFPRNVKSNALEAAREYLAQVESGSTPRAADGLCPHCLGADGKHTSRCPVWRG